MRFTSRPLRLPVLAVALAVLVCASALTSCAPAPDTYLAMGDSAAAGPLVPNQDLQYPGCLRSDHNYPNIARPLVPAQKFVDVSCSGAVTADIDRSQQVQFLGPNPPPQIDAVNAHDKIITITLGANDTGWVDYVLHCATMLPWSAGCAADYTKDGHDAFGDRIAQVQPRLTRVLQEISARAPQAHIFVVSYPQVVPMGNGCYPLVPILPVDLPWLRQKMADLNGALRGAADAVGATYVDVATPSQVHDACQPASERWVEPIVPGNVAAPAHANALGHQKMGLIVAAAINHELGG